MGSRQTQHILQVLEPQKSLVQCFESCDKLLIISIVLWKGKISRELNLQGSMDKLCQENPLLLTSIFSFFTNQEQQTIASCKQLWNGMTPFL